MRGDFWSVALSGGLATNAALGFVYRIFRLMHGGPFGDVIGQAILGILLGALAVVVASGTEWARWAALLYGLLFGIVIMPVWTVAVLIPMRPGRMDVCFTVIYWMILAVIIVSAIAL
jgi:hypothetical protein